MPRRRKVKTPDFDSGNTGSSPVGAVEEIQMPKNNDYKKMYQEDKFARRWYCRHARLGQLRYDKKMEQKAVREHNKKLVRDFLCGKE